MGNFSSKELKVYLDKNKSQLVWSGITSSISTYRLTIKCTGAEDEVIIVKGTSCSRQLKAGRSYEFEVRAIGRDGPCEIRKAYSPTIFTKPSMPTGVVVKNCNGLHVEWDYEPNDCVSYLVKVCPESTNSRESSKKEVKEKGQVKFGYAFLLNQPIPSTYAVDIWAENRECEAGEHHVERFTFQGLLDIHYFFMSKDVDLFVCFCLGDLEFAEGCCAHWKKDGYHAIDRINSLRLHYKKRYDVTLVAMEAGGKCKTMITPASQLINIQSLVNDQRCHNKFAIETTANVLKMKMMFINRDQSSNVIDAYVRWNAPTPNRTAEWLENQVLDQVSDIGYETQSAITGNTESRPQSIAEFKILLDIVAKPGQVAIIHSTDPDALQNELDKYMTQDYKAVTDVSPEFTASSAGVIQVDLRSEAGALEDSEHTITPKDLLGGVVTRMFSYSLARTTQFHMVYHSSQRGMAPFKFPFKLNWSNRAESPSKSSQKPRSNSAARPAADQNVNTNLHVGSAGKIIMTKNRTKAGGNHYKSSSLSQQADTVLNAASCQQDIAIKDSPRTRDATNEKSIGRKPRKKKIPDWR